MDNGFFDLVELRRSSKAGFKPGETLPRESLELIVNAGRLAATGGNMQPWEFIAVTDAEVIARIKSCKPNTSAVIVLAYDTLRHLPDGRTYFVEDLSAAAQSMLLATEALGYAACWIQGGLDIANVTQVLQIPERYRAYIMICLGRVSADTVRRDKRPLDEVLHWQRF